MTPDWCQSGSTYNEIIHRFSVNKPLGEPCQATKYLIKIFEKALLLGIRL